MANATETLNRALELHQSGRLPEAEKLYREIVQADPSHSKAWQFLGVLSGQSGRHDLACEYLGLAATLDPSDAICHCNLGHALRSLGRFADAAASYRHAAHIAPNHAPAYFDLAITLQALGADDEAIASYQRALDLEPRFVAAYNNLGNVLRRRHRALEAERCFRRALQIDPCDAEVHCNLGVLLKDQQRLDEAATEYREAIRLKPGLAEAHSNLGSVYKQQGRLDEAERSFRLALQINPRSPEVRCNLGTLLLDQRRADEAEIHYREALKLKPDLAEALCDLGSVLMQQNRLEEAEASCRSAIACRPDYAEAYSVLGAVLMLRGENAAALASCQTAIQQKPELPEPHSNLGSILVNLGRVDEAIASCQRAIQLKPDNAETHHNLGTALMIHGGPEPSLASYARAIELEPNYAEAHVCRALVWLLTRNFTQGWPEYEWRWKLPGTAPNTYPQPLWDGSPLEGRTILLHAEQGLGDTLQCIRYAPRIKQHGGRVLLGCQPPLVKLLARSPGVDRVLAPGEPVPAFDVHAPMLGLPGVFHTSLVNIPATVPYLFANLELVEHWRRELAGAGQFKIGIAWRGNPKHPTDHFRSIPFRQFATLANMPGVQIYSLQKGAGREELEASVGNRPIIDLADRLQDFDDTAAVVSHLDLVISCDSAVVHLAGGLGVPAWVALPFSPDWRWMLDREDSPWYPSVRLFRQQKLGDWAEVFVRVEQALRAASQKHAGRR